MPLTLLSLGSRGDAQPLAALGVALQRQGVAVRLATHAEFAPLAEAHGLDLAPVATNPRELLDSEAGREWIERGRRDPVAFVRGFHQLVAPVLDQLLDEAWSACQGSDAVVFNAMGGSFTFAGLHVAEALGVPYAQVALWPNSPTSAFASAFLAERARDLGPLNRVSHLAVDQLFWQPFRAQVNRWRARRLGLPALPVGGPYRRLRRHRVLQLCAYSPAVVPVPPDWPVHHPVTGYWFLDRPVGWAPPPQLAAFLDDGPPPVYVGFGSMVARNPDEQTALVLEALRRAGRRGLLAAGWTGLGAGTDALGQDVHVVEEVPHEWLFPRCSAVVIHGGAGSTAAALRAGAPTVVTPYYGDQPYWARRVAELGAGPAPVPQHRLTAGRLAGALTSIDDGVRGRARQLGQRIRTETGVSTAIEQLTTHLDHRW